MTESSKEDKKEKEKKDISLKKRIINDKNKLKILQIKTSKKKKKKKK